MIPGNFKNFVFLTVFLYTNNLPIFAADKIESVPLINLEELSPTFEEGKDELEKIEKKNVNLNKTEYILMKLYVNYYKKQLSLEMIHLIMISVLLVKLIA